MVVRCPSCTIELVQPKQLAYLKTVAVKIQERERDEVGAGSDKHAKNSLPPRLRTVKKSTI
jgi:hypothetical protein